MFTGIIQHVGRLLSAHAAAAGRRLSIDLGPLAELLKAGDSVAVNGACLTVSGLDGRAAAFDVVAETLARTTLGRLRADSKVNLERSLRAGDGLEGHMVAGHIDGTAEVASVRRGGDWTVAFSAPRELIELMVPKGSVAVDGVSLTLAEVAEGRFTVALVPTTLQNTTLGDLTSGDAVNVESDVIGKYVQKYLAGHLGAGGLTLEKLKQAGFA